MALEGKQAADTREYEFLNPEWLAVLYGLTGVKITAAPPPGARSMRVNGRWHVVGSMEAESKTAYCLIGVKITAAPPPGAS
jgi:hypothetical protein